MIIGLGEVLWDLFPSGGVRGNAPFNFAFHCHRLGHSAAVVSRVGDDEPGRDLRAEVRTLGLSDDLVQTDPAHPTGTVTVAVDEQGQPAFTITPDVAWDFLGGAPAWRGRSPPPRPSASGPCATLGRVAGGGAAGPAGGGQRPAGLRREPAAALLPARWSRRLWP